MSKSHCRIRLKQTLRHMFKGKGCYIIKNVLKSTYIMKHSFFNAE